MLLNNMLLNILPRENLDIITGRLSLQKLS